MERVSNYAEKEYESIRKRKTDCELISKNTGIPFEQINKIKRYLFLENHQLKVGNKRFDPDYDIAQSWNRLLQGKDIKKMDIVLLKHELEEIKLVESGIPQSEAHDMANQKYNYQKLVKENRNGKN